MQLNKFQSQDDQNYQKVRDAIIYLARELHSDTVAGVQTDTLGGFKGKSHISELSVTLLINSSGFKAFAEVHSHRSTVFGWQRDQSHTLQLSSETSSERSIGKLVLSVNLRIE